MTQIQNDLQIVKTYLEGSKHDNATLAQQWNVWQAFSRIHAHILKPQNTGSMPTITIDKEKVKDSEDAIRAVYPATMSESQFAEYCQEHTEAMTAIGGGGIPNKPHGPKS